jgi:hypothetical protein
MRLLPKWWRRYFLQIEFLLAVLIGIAFSAWYVMLGGDEYVQNILSDNRSSVYAAAASIYGSLLGFTITATSIVLGFSGSEQMRVVRQSEQYPTLWKVFGANNKSAGLSYAHDL